jgi:quercetin dioxygenase-like cupin family protein
VIISPASGDSHNVLGTTATIKLSSSETNGHLAVILHAVPLNTGPPPHRHEHEDELLYVLDGTFEFILRDPSTWHPATQGTIVHVPAGTLHTSRATTDASQLLSIYTPAGGEEFFREIDTIDQTDLAAVLALASRHGMTFPAPTPERTPCPSA